MLPVQTSPRDPNQPYRTATPLELFVDLAFVVAVAQAAASLEHELLERHFQNGVLGFTLVFFAIWWAWTSLVWFASAYDSDDVPYRLTSFVEMTGVLVLAAGIPRAFDDRDLAVMTLGYVVIRLAAVGHLTRIATSDEPSRPTSTL